MSLPVLGVSAPSHLYHNVTTSARETIGEKEGDKLCNCGRRFTCELCRESDRKKAVNRHIEKFRESLRGGGVAWVSMQSIRNTGDRYAETDELWRRWKALCAMRSAAKRRNSDKGLSFIRRGVASIHLMRDGRFPRAPRYGPHLHSIFATDSEFDPETLIDTWQSLGVGICDIERARDLGDCLGYAFIRSLPEDVNERMLLQMEFKGKRLIRTMGR